jgi:hypothetical protein
MIMTSGVSLWWRVIAEEVADYAELKNQTLYPLEIMSDSINSLSRRSLTYVCAPVPTVFPNAEVVKRRTKQM